MMHVRADRALLEHSGEWHSHPDGIACSPSGDDLNVLSWLTRS